MHISDAGAGWRGISVTLGSPRLKPLLVAFKPLALCSSLLQLNRILHLFHKHWGLRNGDVT